MDKSRPYCQTPYTKSFMYTMEHREENGKGTWLVILNQAGFYLEGGGQPYDTGTLDGTPVLSVHERGEQVIHRLAQPIEERTLAERVIDWQRRYDNTQLHTGEHVLPGLVHRRLGYDNVDFHAGTEEVTADFNDVIEPEEPERLKDKANQLVYANAPVKVFYPTEEELRTMEYRSREELPGLVCIVEVPGKDVHACCGTYVENIGEMGITKIRSTTHCKGGVRLPMPYGRRILLDYRDRLKDEIRISSLPSAKLIQVPDIVERLRNDCQDRNFLIEKLGGSLVVLKAGQLPESIDPLIVLEEDLTPVQARQYTTLFYEEDRAGVVTMCFGNDRDGEYHYALNSSRMDMRAFSKTLNSRLSGRGGGNSLTVQGTFRAG